MRTDEIRRRNEQRCARILQSTSPLRSDDLDWSSIGTELDDDTVAALEYMRDVEGFTDRDLVGFTAHRTTLGDPLVGRFLEVWRAEEAGHTAALTRYLDHYASATGERVRDRQHPPPARAPLTERMLASVGGPVGNVVAAAHMTWGAANELLTLNGYRLLSRTAQDPVLAELLSRIAAQESRHFSFYLLQAEWRLGASPIARAVIPRLLRKAWTPVGVGDEYKQQADFDRLLTHLLGDNVALVQRMDRRFSSLPGLSELRIFERLATTSVAA